jgi:hypothetical protein
VTLHFHTWAINFPRTVYPKVLPIEYPIKHNFQMSLSASKSLINREHESELLYELTCVKSGPLAGVGSVVAFG